MAAVLTGFLLPVVALADATRAEVQELFARSSKVAPSALAAAREHYEKVTGDGHGPLVDYAFALVLIEQHQLDEASRLLTKLLSASPNALPPRRTQIWIQLARKQYPEALTEMESLAGKLALVKTLSTDHRDTARFLGSAIGFLSGPASSPRLDKLLAASREQIVKQLSKETRAEFEAGFSDTSKLFEKLRGETSAAKDEVNQIQTDAINAQSEQLESERTANDAAKEELEARADARKQETQAELDALNEKLSELQEKYSSVTARGAPLQAQISAAQAEITAQTQLVQQDDGSQTIVYRDPQRVRFLEQLISQSQIQLAPLQAELNTINFRVADLRNKNADLLRRHNIDLQKMFGEGQKLAKNQTKLDRMEKINAKAKPSGASTRTRTLTARLTTFGTYEPFPLAKEKDRVLRALK